MHCNMQCFMQCIIIVHFVIKYSYKRAKMAFHIKPDKKESENKTIRFPLPLIKRIEETIKGNNITFSRFVIQACEYALDNLEDQEDE